MIELDDLTQLALEAQGGDTAAFANLVRRSQVDVWRICAHLAGPDQADDLTQETFLRVWLALPRYQPRASVRRWAFTIAHHAAVDAVRTRTRLPVPTGSVGERLVDDAADPLLRANRQSDRPEVDGGPAEVGRAQVIVH